MEFRSSCVLYFLRGRLLLPYSISDAAVAATALFLIPRSPWQHDVAPPSSEPQMSRHTFHAVYYQYGCWQHLGDAAILSSEAKASSRCSVLQDPLIAARAISLLNDRELGAIGGRRRHLRK